MLFFFPLAQAAQPCIAETSGPGWKLHVEVEIADDVMSKATQTVTLDLPAQAQPGGQFQYNSQLGNGAPVMARVQLIEVGQPGQALRHSVEFIAPEVYAPNEAMMSGFMGTTAPTYPAAFRVVAAGQSVDWLYTGMMASPVGLSSANTNIYTAVVGDLGPGPDATLVARAERILGAFAQSGSLLVETRVSKPAHDGARPRPSDVEDLANTEVAGTFELTAAALNNAMAAQQSLQPLLGQQYAAGTCGAHTQP